MVNRCPWSSLIPVEYLYGASLLSDPSGREYQRSDFERIMHWAASKIKYLKRWNDSALNPRKYNLIFNPLFRKSFRPIPLTVLSATRYRSIWSLRPFSTFYGNSVWVGFFKTLNSRWLPDSYIVNFNVIFYRPY